MEWRDMRDHYEDLFAAAKARGETQETIAARGGIRQNKISNLLAMKDGLGPQAETFVRAIKGLDITPAQFFATLDPLKFSKESRTDADSDPSTASAITAPGTPVHHVGARGSLSPPPSDDPRIAIAEALTAAATHLRRSVGQASANVRRTARKVEHAQRKRKGGRAAGG